MKTVSFTLPMMYGDHHVLAVRQLLNALPGISQIYASSSFQIVEVEYDEQQVSEGELQDSLAEAGYLEEIMIPAEVGTNAADQDIKPFFRHTAVFNQTRSTISFGQTVPEVERPLWPCPGIKSKQ
ncbi:MAG: heavy-metal-associated domain-containing protein [Ardenticatenaceae bacterium]|nr:heavy-metal-associated domain-containing protein [Anaerolineales bacterium]MCB9006017.1 heavy-metal-associated domain-containing protein [Ardenticatenaceae bacterium]